MSTLGSRIGAALVLVVTAIAVVVGSSAKEEVETEYDQGFLDTLNRAIDRIDRNETLAGLRRGDPAALIFFSESAFESAAAYGFVEFITETCKSKEVSESERYNSMITASILGDTNMIEALMECGVSPDVRLGDELGLWSPAAGAAAEYGQIDALKLLIRNGASLSGGCKNGVVCPTPLIDALLRADHAVLDLLVKSGYELSETDVNMLGHFVSRKEIED